MDGETSLTTAARWLGYAGLLPQIVCVTLATSGHEFGYTALAGGFAYAAAIFSFLGGVWWGQALANGKAGASACPHQTPPRKLKMAAAYANPPASAVYPNSCPLVASVTQT
ncbi:MAG: DUF3429 domain-containing protein, partial [Erythrobacter sp.]|nr:DUF3429 domain-containing protein [Erythrobacter sp.]